MRKHKEEVARNDKLYLGFISYSTDFTCLVSESFRVILTCIFQDIDEYLCQAKDKSYDTLMHFGKKSLNVAATAAVMAATKVTLLSLL